MRVVFHTGTLLFALAILVAAIACGSDPTPRDDQPGESLHATSTTSAATRVTSSPTPGPTSTPFLRFPEMAISLKEGDFWKFRWEWTKRSCAQGSGCSDDAESGEFQVTLGEPSTIDGKEMFEVLISGTHVADSGSVDFAPAWNFLGSDGPRLLGHRASTSVTIFDATDGEWLGGGFFGRFDQVESNLARSSTVDTQEFASWPGVRTGPAISVVRSDSQSNCEIIEGRRICPNDSSFSISETQYFRNGVGPLGYNFRSSASFSGGGFFSSSTSEENVALVASSLRGDVIEPTPTLGRPPRLGATPTPEIDLDVVFGPQDGTLILTNIDDQIPDFKTGVNIAVGVVDVTFVNPDAGGGNWSYGITFRHSDEETFHAIYVTSDGLWQHFSRGGSVESQISSDPGSVTLNLGVGAENRLFVAFEQDAAAFFVNGELVGELDLSTSNARVAGDVRVIAGVLNTDTYNGAESEFFDLTVLAP